MKLALVTLARIFLLLSIVAANVPLSSKVTVCVLGTGEVVVPVGKCRMPCCADKAQSPAPSVKKSCCKPKPSVEAASSVCPMAAMACRCETRYTVTSAPPIAKFERAIAVPAAHELPAVLPAFRLELPTPRLETCEPGIRGVDSGPPRRPIRSPKQSRAPPVSV